MISEWRTWHGNIDTKLDAVGRNCNNNVTNSTHHVTCSVRVIQKLFYTHAEAQTTDDKHTAINRKIQAVLASSAEIPSDETVTPSRSFMSVIADCTGNVVFACKHMNAHVHYNNNVQQDMSHSNA
jgi:hypothetical protein